MQHKEKITLVLLPDMDGTGKLFAPLCNLHKKSVTLTSECLL